MNPIKILEKLKGAKYHEIATTINSRFYGRIGADTSVDVMAEDWDSLVILDACRYDMMVDLAPSNWNVQSRRSPGSDSSEFIERSYVGRELHDVVYVTSNPHATNIPEGTFHAVEYLLDEFWDSDYQTVMPDTMVEQTLKSHQKYPNKRIISHWMQPHFPFISDFGQKLRTTGIGEKSNKAEYSEAPHPWVALMEGEDIESDDVVRAYIENLREAMGPLRELIDKMPGKTIVTADHANLTGELTLPVPLRTYGHPSNFHKKELVTIPWIEFESDSRRDIRSDEPQTTADLSDDVVSDRLESLGYV
ncbi:hypothetical protein SAMN04487950_0412 [Halogranum rubrum]|uniref:Uncharacterized protein n=1 Tax=Halogranum rubrum TaxID=553466 RepID=A0A1I4BBS6_9EURY|nr:hypothetical protein [Halogranum rubrum]SFK65466.1 hypothetical protein SAMN04487950_0412 [Halogranum rubrum]